MRRWIWRRRGLAAFDRGISFGVRDHLGSGISKGSGTGLGARGFENGQVEIENGQVGKWERRGHGDRLQQAHIQCHLKPCLCGHILSTYIRHRRCQSLLFWSGPLTGDQKPRNPADLSFLSRSEPKTKLQTWWNTFCWVGRKISKKAQPSIEVETASG